jgi:hypothetical protein
MEPEADALEIKALLRTGSSLAPLNNAISDNPDHHATGHGDAEQFLGDHLKLVKIEPMTAEMTQVVVGWRSQRERDAVGGQLPHPVNAIALDNLVDILRVDLIHALLFLTPGRWLLPVEGLSHETLLVESFHESALITDLIR